MPVKSKKRVKRSPVEITVKAAETLPFPNKGSKVLELPVELLMEILSYFGRLPIPLTADKNLSSLGVDTERSSRYLERTDVLRALSQTCKVWRHLFFPLLWERLEPCLTHSSGCAWYKLFGESLIRKSSFVCENPAIASHVRSMSVVFSRYSPATVLPACVRAIEALPNLHTLQIVRTHDKMANALKEAFDGHVFPGVRTISLPSHAHHILRCCPEVRKVICNIRMDASTLVSAISNSCKKVEEIQGFRGTEKVMKRLAKAVPNLRSIKFDYPIPSSHLQHFSLLKKLAHITLFSNQIFEKDAMVDAESLACITLAKDIVRKAEGRRTVTVEYYDLFRNTHPAWSRGFNVDI
ncbi:hypothetical protein M413DRAFT_443348 [Hebeloma cylindrosporum]|uniref:Uncharacterized protein n=1 Tax=Hebeloma cylindrosporum TaxID=76867 RepID=A0A0C2YTL2_HEBCY|nr:hypothetical protein M413DRAFT_443348 [Hebeloma cylindrosporum h7]